MIRILNGWRGKEKEKGEKGGERIEYGILGNMDKRAKVLMYILSVDQKPTSMS